MIGVTNLFKLTILFTVLGLSSLANALDNLTAGPSVHIVRDASTRSDDTCADPSLARTVYQAFSGSKISHLLHFHWAAVNANSRQPAGPAFWTFQGPVFRAWPTQQPSTVPLFVLTTPTNSDFAYLVGADADTLPVLSGFSTNIDARIAWVYNTEVCGSVPLMSAVLATQSDHYYTTDPDEHAALLAAGWADGGLIAYVLPLPSW